MFYYIGMAKINDDRIIFGTDSSDADDVSDAHEPEEEVDIRGYAAMEVEFLRSDSEIEVFGKKIKGINLPESSQKLIFSENFHSLTGFEPKKLNIAGLMEEAAFIGNFLKTEEDKETLKHIVSTLDKIK